MNPDNLNAEDAKLRALLRESRAAPELPPRFEENVWRRIEAAEAGRPADSAGWLDVLLARLFRPRLAFAVAATLMVAGGVLGAREGTQLARQDAQAHYLAAVAPNPLR